MARHKKKNSSNLILFFIISAIIIISVFGKILTNIIPIIILIIALSLIIYWYLRIQNKSKLRREMDRIRAALLAAGTANPMQLTPEQYEQFCATILLNNGWNARLTKKTGDFGADIVADKEEHKLVIQCKQWSKSVGIKAVQEVHTALTHYNGNKAIVVTTTGYTQAARELAKSTGVSLLSHSDLIDM